MITKLSKDKKLRGLIGILLILIAVSYIFFFSKISPFKTAPIGSIDGEKIALEGFWGFLGFYRNPYDNRHTFFLLLIFCSLAIMNIFKSNILNKSKTQRKKIK